MPDYKQMYHIMFNAATDAERLLDGDTKASLILRQAQQRCEELYLHDDPEPVRILTESGGILIV